MYLTLLHTVHLDALFDCNPPLSRELFSTHVYVSLCYLFRKTRILTHSCEHDPVWFLAQVEDREDCKTMFFRMDKASLRLGIPECIGNACNCVDDTKNVSTLSQFS